MHIGCMPMFTLRRFISLISASNRKFPLYTRENPNASPCVSLGGPVVITVTYTVYTHTHMHAHTPYTCSHGIYYVSATCIIVHTHCVLTYLWLIIIHSIFLIDIYRRMDCDGGWTLL